jgi:hypothetical protein
VFTFLFGDAAAVAAADAHPPLLGLEMIRDAGDAVAATAPVAV